LNILVMWLGM